MGKIENASDCLPLSIALLAEDCSWILGIEERVKASRDGAAQLACLPQVMRIAYEGRKFIEKANNCCFLIGRNADPYVERSRNSIKMLDTKTGYPELNEFFAKIAQNSREHFIERVRKRWRWLANDLGLFFMDSHVVASTQSMVHCLGLDSSIIRDPAGNQKICELSCALGKIVEHISVLVRAEIPTSFSDGRVFDSLIKGKDMVEESYLRERFGGSY
ncbi:MAG: hypothetical protein ACRDAX_04075 [Propionibacteriaceae bacterium]